MKKLLLPLCVMSVILSACGDDQEGFQMANQEGISFTVADFIDENGTRVDVSVDASGANFTWTEGDTLGVFPQNGYQTAFPISDGVGTNTAVFDGADWALRPKATYSAYYPLQHNYDLNKKAIPVSYEGQVQNGNGSTSHLGDYDYLAAQYSPVDANGNANFTLNHLGCLVRFQLTMPEADTYKSMTLSCEDACLKTEARYDLTATTPALSAKKLSESITLGLSNVSTTEAKQVLTLYMMLPPMELSGREIAVNVLGEKEYNTTIVGKNMKAGSIYGFSNAMVSTHEWVDLGVIADGKKVLWATTNLGAESPEDYGDHFAWGETVPYGGEDKSNFSNYNYAGSYTKTYYGWETYKYCNGLQSTMTKYVLSSHASEYGYNGFYDNKTELDPEDDAATANWGELWRTPTRAEQDALRSQCTWTWVTSYNGKSVNGCKVSGNGHEIFLPAAGNRKGFSPVGSRGYYWSSSLDESNSDYARYLNVYSDGSSCSRSDRYRGISVRPVRKVQEYSVFVSSLSLNKSSLTLYPGWTESFEPLTVKVSPSNAETHVKWTSSDESVATVDVVGVVTAIKAGTATIRATTVDGSGKYAECVVTVNSKGNAPADVEAVDLGVVANGKKVLWATTNLGAESPEDYGDHFAWGETVPYGGEDKSNFSNYNYAGSFKKTYYDYSTYKYAHHYNDFHGVYNNYLTKYVLSKDTEYGYNCLYDNKTELDPEDDAATANWGGKWRTPTYFELHALYDQCTWTWVTSYNGKSVSGYKVSGNGHEIFLPAAGYRNRDMLEEVGTYGYYWSSTLASDPRAAGIIRYSSSFYYFPFYKDRSYGQSVRPVRKVQEYSVFVSSLSLNKSSLALYPDATEILTVKVSPSNAETHVKWTSSDESVATVDATGEVSINESGVVNAIKAGTATIRATTVDGSGKYAECVVTVKGKINTPADVEAVDLGVVANGKKVLWANMNVGAESPTDYGGYFAWGETVPYGGVDKSNARNYRYTGGSYTKTYYSSVAYKYCNEYNTLLTKYVLSSQASKYGYNGFYDNKTELDPEDDAATANWGGKWRTPTHAEYRALYEQCTWTWVTSYNGKSVNGYKVSGNGHEIFLPAAGSCDDFSPGFVGTYGYYWSSSLDESYPNHAWDLNFDSGGVNPDYGSYRYFGQSVRPVRAAQN